MNCPKCDADISETYEPDDPSVGVVGGWYCDACDLGVGEWEVAREPLEGDVPIPPAPRRLDGKIGTPISELSGQPGDPNDLNDPRHAGFAGFKRIARTYGYD
jgi:hypothetical protein